MLHHRWAHHGTGTTLWHYTMVLQQQADTLARPHQGNSPLPQASNPDHDLGPPSQPLLAVSHVSRVCHPSHIFHPNLSRPGNIECGYLAFRQTFLRVADRGQAVIVAFLIFSLASPQPFALGVELKEIKFSPKSDESEGIWSCSPEASLDRQL